MLAFQAPPEAVTKPVIRYGKIAGRSNFRQRSSRPKWNISQTSLRSVGMAVAPAMTLNRMYHCVPSSNKMIEPIPRPPPIRIRKSKTIEHKRGGGPDAAIGGVG